MIPDINKLSKKNSNLLEKALDIKKPIKKSIKYNPTHQK